MNNRFAWALLAGPALLGAGPAAAGPELITNGGFDQTTLTTSTQFSGGALTGWANAATSGATGYGYNFVTQSGTADTTGFTTLAGTRNRLIGPNGSVLTNNLGLNGMPAASPDGGNFLISSTDTTTGGAVSQTVNGLVAGQGYVLSFYWAAAQFAGTLAATSEYWKVTFGGATQSTAVAAQGIGGFSAWTKTTMTFVASSAQQTLSFLAVGAPNGVPSAGLLDSVSLTAVMEPSSWALMVGGLAATGLLAQRRRANGRAKEWAEATV